MSGGRWKVHVEVKDKCGKIFKDDVYVDVKDIVTNPYIDVDIDVFDDDCTGSTAGCTEIEFEDEEDDGDDVFDFDGDVSTSCTVGTIQYKWTFMKESGTPKFIFTTEFVDNFDFLEYGVWKILLEVVDGCGQT